jgi:hypothetical protein
VWNRQRTDLDLVDPASTGLGRKPVQRWNLPEGWVISCKPAHPAIISEADYIAAQDSSAPRGPAGSAARRYLLAGLLAGGKQYLPARPTQATDQVASPAQAAELIDRLRADDITLIYDPATRALRTDTKNSLAVTVG